MTGDPHPAQHAAAEHLRLLAAADLDAWAALFATAATFTFPFAPPGMVTEVHGRDALHAHMRGFTETFDARLVELTFVATDGPHVAVARESSTGPPGPPASGSSRTSSWSCTPTPTGWSPGSTTTGTPSQPSKP